MNDQPSSAIVAHGNAGLRWLARKDPDIDEAQKALQRIAPCHGLRAAELITSIRGMFRKDSHEKLRISVTDSAREVLKLIHGDLERWQIILRIRIA